MSNKPTLDEILLEHFLGEVPEKLRTLARLGALTDDDYLQTKQQLTQLIADIIGEDVIPNETDGLLHQVQLRQNALRAKQRQTAKERGIDLKAGDGAS